jgi:hypothetical protein
MISRRPERSLRVSVLLLARRVFAVGVRRFEPCRGWAQPHYEHAAGTEALDADCSTSAPAGQELADAGLRARHWAGTARRASLS